MARPQDRQQERPAEQPADRIRSRPDVEIVNTVVTQSSDEAFHCIAITLFFKEQV